MPCFTATIVARKKIFFFLFLFLLMNVRGLSQFTVGGTAISTGVDCYQLTAALGSQAGYVYQNAALNLNEPFNYKFQVNLGTNNAGADGIMFVLRGSLGVPYIGANGGAIGFDGPGFSSNSIGIEVDTWDNGIGANGDIAADHIGIFKNGTNNHLSVNSLAGPIQAAVGNVNVEDGNDHTLNIRWDPVTQELEVYFDCDYRLQHVGDIINTIFNGDTLVHWGFLGTTGGASNVQSFCFTEVIDSLVNEMNDETICAGASVQLDAGTSALDYSWSPSLGLSSTVIHNPIASPTVTTVYVVEASYQCDTLLDTVNVTVIQPSFTTSGVVTEPLCHGDCDGAIDLSVSNANGTYHYTWSNGDTTQDVSSLCQGTYYVTVQDMDTASATYLCTLEDTFVVGEPPLLTADIINASKTSCPYSTSCDASADGLAGGGVSPYSYSWSNGEVGVSAFQLCPDTNWITITDAQNCEAIAFEVIEIPDTIKTDAFSDTLICISSSAAIIGSSVGGTPPFTYIWTEGSLTGPVVSTNQFYSPSPVVSTQYFVASTDSKGCVGDTAEVWVNVRPALGIEIPHIDTICPYDTIPIEVAGLGGDTIYTYSWSSGQFGASIDVSPDLPQWYYVTVSDFCGTPSYIDSVYVQVGGYSDIRATIRLDDDSLCAGDQTFMIASARGGYGGQAEYQYKWSVQDETTNILFVRPPKTRIYTVTISDLCLSEPGIDTVTIHVGNPIPPLFEVSPKEVCIQTDVFIKLTNFNELHTYRWAFGDDDTLFNYELDSIFYTYSKPGCYDVNIASVTEFGCFSQRTEACAVKVLNQPEAIFQNHPSEPTNITSILDFKDVSVGAVKSVWYVEDDTLYNIERFQREFKEEGQPFDVKLVVTSSDGCVDSLIKSLNFNYETLLYYPKAFTPNQDGVNDVFFIVGEAINLEGFELVIFDRWGHEIFSTKDASIGWNGFLKDGSRAPQGAYPFVLSYYNNLGELKRVRDQVIISAGGKKRELR